MTEYGLLAPYGSLCQSFRANCSLGADCDYSGYIDGSVCECLAFQLPWKAVFTTTVYASLDADTTSLTNVIYVSPGDTVDLVATPGFNSYTWSGTGLVNSSGNVATVVAMNTGNCIYVQKVWVSASSLSCNLADTVYIVVYDPLDVDADISNPTNTYRVCSGITVTLEATPGLSYYSWSGDGNIYSYGNSASVSISSSLPADTQYVYLSASDGTCYDWDTVTFYIFNAPPLTISSNVIGDPDIPQICAGDTIILTATPGYDVYEWTGPYIVDTLGNVAKVYFSDNRSELIEINLTANKGDACIKSRTKYIHGIVEPQALFAITNINPQTRTVFFVNQSSDYFSCTWDFGDGIVANRCEITEHTYPAPGLYTIRLIVENPCGTDTFELDVQVGITFVELINGNYFKSWVGDNGVLYIKSQLPVETIMVTDVSGRIVWVEKSFSHNGLISITLPAPGLYNVSLITVDNMVYHWKAIKPF